MDRFDRMKAMQDVGQMISESKMDLCYYRDANVWRARTPLGAFRWYESMWGQVDHMNMEHAEMIDAVAQAYNAWVEGGRHPWLTQAEMADMAGTPKPNKTYRVPEAR